MDEDLSFLTDEEETPAELGQAPADKVLITRIKAARALRDEKEELEARIKEINKALAELEPIILAELDALDIKNLRVDGVGLVYKSETVVPTVLEPDAFLEWLDLNGESGISRRTVHHQTLKAWYKERLANGEQLPGVDVVKTFTVREVRFRKK